MPLVPMGDNEMMYEGLLKEDSAYLTIHRTQQSIRTEVYLRYGTSEETCLDMCNELHNEMCLWVHEKFHPAPLMICDGNNF